MNSTELFPESDWDTKRMFFQGQMRSVAICKKRVIFGGRELICGYPCRKDRPNERNHLCTFNRITKFFGDPYTTTQCDLTFFNMIVRTNMSFSAAVSDQMYEFIYFLIRAGQNSVVEKLPSNIRATVPSSTTIFPKVSRQTISRNFSRAADSIKRRILDSFKKFENVCLAIDAGKINGNPILDVTIVHVFAPPKPLLFRAFREFNGTTEDYISKIKDIIDELNSMPIKVTSIVGDNVPAQKQAFNVSDISMQKKKISKIYLFYTILVQLHLPYNISYAR